MNFADFSLHATLLQNILDMGYTQATDIQVQVMPMALDGKDVSGLSRTGTGKTAAFLIPTIQRLSQLEPDRIALFLAPTRELAQQIMEESVKISKGMDMGSVTIVGGMSSEDQIAALKKGARLIAGTPGRVIDLFKERYLDLSKVDILVFDEADRMFDMGFIKDMQYVLSKVNPKRQILLFSATMNFSVLNMLYEYGANPQEINVSRDQMTADKIEQVLYHVGDREKPASLMAVCKKHSPDQGTIIVFVNYKERVPWVAAFLTKNGIPAQGLSSLMRQEKRNKIIQGFKSGQFRALVATDVASRGLDVEDISLVVNYHLPEEAATYVHRIGRTARAGKHGIAVAISSSEDAYNQIRIEEFLNTKIPVQWLDENEIPKDVKMPGRGEVEEEEAGEEGMGSGGVPPARGGRDRGPRGAGRTGGGDRGGRGGRGPAPSRERRPHASDVYAPGTGPA
ncbi:MAG: DEAD/DEAH box helicase, partial [Bdellovibrionota bacterium]